MQNRDTPRRCLRAGCSTSMATHAPQARHCSGACRQAAYRQRKEEKDEETPTVLYEVAGVASTVSNGDGWDVHFLDGQTVTVPGCMWEGQARARARWSVAQRVHPRA